MFQTRHCHKPMRKPDPFDKPFLIFKYSFTFTYSPGANVCRRHCASEPRLMANFDLILWETCSLVPFNSCTIYSVSLTVTKVNALHRFVKIKDGFAAVINFVLNFILFKLKTVLVVFLTTCAGVWFVSRFSDLCDLFYYLKHDVCFIIFICGFWF